MSVSIHNLVQGRSAVEISASIEQGIRSGALSPGDSLLTVRALAEKLEVSPATVAAAYKTLKGRGLVDARGRRGTRVSARPPIHAGLDSLRPALQKGVRDLAIGNPDPALLPDLGRALAKLDASPVLYGDPLVDPALERRSLKRFRADGIPAEHVCVVNGAMDGLERVLTAHLLPGDRVAIEDPAFVGVRDLLAALGLVAVPVAIDDAGPIPDALERALSSGVQAMIVTPRAQNPYGSALEPKRIAKLARILAAHRDVLLCEDDHAGLVAGAPARTLVDTRTRGRWAVVRSFSKSLGPDLRVALLAADPETTARVEGRQLLGIRWVSHLLQRLVLAVWTDKAVQANLRRAARTYTERRRGLIDALAAEGIEAHGRSGLNVWIPVPAEAPLLQSMLDRGWALSGGDRFRLAAGPGLRVCIATLTPADAKRFAVDFSQALQPPRRSGGA